MKGSTRRDLEAFTERRRKFFVSLFWFSVMTMLLVLWLAGFFDADAQTQITPRQIRGLATLTVMQCSGVTGTGSDCTGLYYLDFVRADGTELKIIGTPPAPGFTIDPTHWSVVP